MKKKICKIIVALQCAFILATNYINVQAADKSVTTEISSDYKSAIFKVEMSSPGTFTGTLVSPKGETYEYTMVGDDILTCTVSNVKAGEWITTISTDSGNVPKYTLSVSKSRDSSTEAVDSSINVGKDIVGLAYYFRDNTLCVQWTDTSVGDVQVKVVNLNNSEVIYDSSVAEKSVEVEIPEGVSTVALSVVPTTSKNVDGAVQTFELQLPSDNSIVQFSGNTFSTNGKEQVKVTISENRSFLVYDNDVQIYKSNMNEAGTYDIELPLGDNGENNIVFYVVDDANNMYSYSNTVILDTVGPDVKIEGDYSNYRTSDDIITITGTVTDFVDISVNETPVTVATDGTFSTDINLHVGTNEIVVKALDEAGNDTVFEFSIERYEEEGNPIGAIVVIGGFVAFIGFLVYKIFFKKKVEKKKAEKEESKKEEVTQLKAEAKDESEEKVVTKKKKTKQKDIDVFEHENAGVLGFFNKHKNETIVVVSWAIILFIIFNFVLYIGNVASGSMEPTFMTGDTNIYNRLAYKSKDIERGDIIVFKDEETGDDYAKRVIGIAGDTIEFHDGYVYLNGELLDESAYLDEDVDTNCLETFTVPEGRLFVMGDNRENSKDSRFFSYHYVSVKNVKGKYLFTLPF